MAIEPVKIPQNVYVEDTIVGPVTLRQLIITGVGCGISYALYSMVLKNSGGNISPYLTAILWIPGVVSAAFAFLKINDLNLFTIVLLCIERLNKPMTRTWIPHKGITINLITRPQENNDVVHAKSTENIEKLAGMARDIEERHHKLDELSKHDMLADQEEIEEELHKEQAVPVRSGLRMRGEIQADPLKKESSIDGIGDVSRFHQALQN